MFRPELVRNRNVRPNFPPQQVTQGIQTEALNLWWPMLPAGADGFSLYTYPPGDIRRATAEFRDSWDNQAHWLYDLDVGWYLSFDEDRYLFRSNREFWKFDVGETITISLWMNPSGTGTDRQQTLISSGGYAVARNWSVLYNNPSQWSGETNDNKISFQWGNGSSGTSFSTSAGVITPGEWNHVVAKMTYGTSGSGQIWVNGEVVASGGGTSTSPYTGFQNLYFGNNATDAGLRERYVGGMTDVRIYRDHPNSEGLAKAAYEKSTRWALYFPQKPQNKTFFIPHIPRNALIPTDFINTPQVGVPSLDTTAQFRISHVTANIVGQAVGVPKISSIAVEILGGFEADLQGGALLGGESDNSTPDQAGGDTRYPAGGVNVGGEADKITNSLIDAEGGAIVSGFFTVEPTVKVTAIASQIIGKTKAGKVSSIGIEVIGVDFYYIDSGAIVGGEANVSPWERYPVSGGSVIGGTADLTFYDVVDGTGGIEIGGQVETYNEYIEDGTGGIELGGTIGQEYFNTALGGAVVGGTGFIFEGIFGGGEAEVNVVYPLEMIGGAVLAGDVAEGFVLEDQFLGGVEVGGDADETVAIVVGNTGVNVGGSADEYFFDNVVGTGGGIVNGKSIKVEFWQLIADGGIELGGEAPDDVGRVFFAEGDGGVLFEGTHDFWHVLTQRPEGGIDISGEIDPPFLAGWNYTYDMTGRIVLGSETSIKVDSFEFVSDGADVIMGGDAAFVVIYNDRNCTTFRCNVNYPNNYVECFLPVAFDPRQGKGRPRWEGGAALLPAITACRQFLYLPPPDDEDDET